MQAAGDRTRLPRRKSSSTGTAMTSYPTGFEADDRLRSTFIRKLTLSQLEQLDDTSLTGLGAHQELIPRTLVQYWNDPSDIPDDVRKCMNSWEILRDDGFSVRIYGDTSAREYIAKNFDEREVAAFERCRHPAMRSDYFRLCFVLAEGGLYVDTDDVLCGDGWTDVFRDGALKVQPLCYDVASHGMLPAAQIRKPDLPTDGRIFYVNNNPIAAPPRHPVLQRALRSATDKLLGEDPAPEIQSTTGPGVLSASLAAHANDLLRRGAAADYSLLLGWDSVVETRWDLAYRRDGRNWRNMYSDLQARAGKNESR